MTNNEKTLSEKLKARLSGAVCICVGDSMAYIDNHQVSIDENVDIVPILKQRRTLIPIGFVSKIVDAVVTDTGRKIIINFKGKNIEIVINEKRLFADGIGTEIDVPAQVIDNQVFLPIRSIMEYLDKKVFWDDRGIVVISDVEKIFDEQEDKELVDELAKAFDVTITSKEAKEKLKRLISIPADAEFEFIRLERINNKKYIVYQGYIETVIGDDGERNTQRDDDFGIYYVDRNSGEVYQLDIALENNFKKID